MQKKLLSGLFWVLLANLLVKPLWILGIEVGVQNAVGNEVYGFYFSILSISLIFNILLDLGITNFNTATDWQTPGGDTGYQVSAGGAVYDGHLQRGPDDGLR